MLKIYLCSGWFKPNQVTAIEQIEEVIDELKLRQNTFMPRHDTNEFFSEKGPDWDGVFSANITHLDKSTLLIASTVDYDAGSIWECGYAYSKKIPIIYYNPFMESREKFNLMLARSGLGVCINKDELRDFLVNLTKYEHKGLVE